MVFSMVVIVVFKFEGGFKVVDYVKFVVGYFLGEYFVLVVVDVFFILDVVKMLWVCGKVM